jgi:outer membrane receptor protein involved in Fe transport
MARSSILRSMLLTSACLLTINVAYAQDVAPVEEETEARQQTVVVRGQFIPNEVRSTSEVANLIDAADFTLQGDSDAAAALSRVAGIATSEDNFIYVRGLNERYSSALLNGSPLPSPAPLRRVAPLDLFPTSALKSILVQKTYSPDLPGEFGGGLVDIRTKSIPSERFFEASIGGGLNTVTSLQEGLLYDGSDTDVLGYDDGTRDLPDLSNGLTPEFGRELTNNSSLLIMQEGEVNPNFDFGLTAGERFDINDDLSIGIIASGGYSNEWVTKEGRRGNAFVPSADQLAAFDDFERRSTENSIGVDGFASIGVEIFDNHEISFNGLITRSSEKEARTNIGVNDIDEPRRIDSLEWIERQLWSTQVRGEHFFPSLLDLEVDWRGSYSEASREAPYQLTTIYTLDDDLSNPQLINTQDGNQFQFSNVNDTTSDIGIDFVLPFENYSGECSYFCEVNLKAGFSHVENDREATSQTFGIIGTGGVSTGSRVDFVYNALFNTFDANGNTLGRVATVSDTVQPSKYIAEMEVDAAYFGIDAQITPHIRAALGGRFEDGRQAIVVGGINDDLTQSPADGLIEETDFLPAATITWNPIDALQVRMGYSKTLTRPQFRELASAIFVNTETDVTFIGNPFLKNAEIENFDIRAEYYFDRSQFITLGLFYKDMLNPVEEVIVPTENIQTTFLNAPAAELLGFEIEYEQRLDFEEWLGWEFLGDNELTVKTNYTWSDSEVTAGRNPNEVGLTEAEFCAQFPSECVAVNVGTPLDPVSGLRAAAGRIEDGRPLQGQSEHLFNLQVIYTNPDADFDANILFNYVSERIRTAETLARNIPAILEEPPTTVDLVFNKGFEAFGGEYHLTFKAQNVFGEGYDAFQQRGDQKIAVDTYDLGTVFSFGLKRTF